MFDRMNVMLVYVACSSVLRTLSQCFGHSTRLFFQGLPIQAPVRAPRLRAAPAAGPAKKVVRRRVKKRSSAPAPSEDLELSAQMLRYQQMRERQRRQQLGMA